MMLWQWLIPLVTAFTGWLVITLVLKLLFKPLAPKTFAGIGWQGIYSKRKEQIAKATAGFIGRELLSFNVIEEKITDPQAFRQLTPLIEAQVDHFIRVKLTQTMPYITAFIGEKTIEQLKAVFMEELEVLFPELMKNYFGHLSQTHDIEKIVAEKINSISPQTVEAAVQTQLAKDFFRLKLAAAAIGFAVGLLYLLVTLIA